MQYLICTLSEEVGSILFSIFVNQLLEKSGIAITILGLED